MPDLLAPIMPSRGISFVQEDGRFIATGTVVRGQVLEADIEHTDSGTTTDAVGSTASSLVRAVHVQNIGELGGRTIIIALERARAGQEFRAMIRGVVDILVYGEFSAGSVLVLNATSGSTLKRVFGFVLQSGGTADMASPAQCLWDGETGFAQLVAAEAPGGDPTFPTDDVPVNDPGDPDPPDPGEGEVPDDVTVQPGAIAIGIGLGEI